MNLRRMLWEMEAAEAAAHSEEDEDHNAGGNTWMDTAVTAFQTSRLGTHLTLDAAEQRLHLMRRGAQAVASVVALLLV
jgi:hypothetical protein